MYAIRLVSVLGAVLMTAAILYAFASGDFFAEGSIIWGLPWGKVSLIDIYVGLALFGAWIAFREGDWIRTSLWWVGLVVLGNLAAAAYLAIAAFSSRDVPSLLLGRRRA